MNQHFNRCLLTLLILAHGMLLGWCNVVQAQSPSRIYSILPGADGANLSLVADENTIPGRNFLGSPVASHDGNWVVFDATKGRAFSGTKLIRIAIAGPDKGKVVDLGYGVGPSFSPDDKRIAFFLNNNNPEKAERGVWIMNTDGSGRERIGRGLHPQWSPDGSMVLAMGSFRSPRNLTSINIANRQQQRLLKNETVIGQPAWSPDGKQIALTVKDGEDRVLCLFTPEPETTSRAELWRVPWDGSYDETWPDWSPDATRILFTFWNVEGRAQSAMNVAVKPGSKAAKIDFVPPGADIRDCQWSSDGKRILFASSSSKLFEQATSRSE